MIQQPHHFYLLVNLEGLSLQVKSDATELTVNKYLVIEFLSSKKKISMHWKTTTVWLSFNYTQEKTTKAEEYRF